jgi:alkylmercury lyase
MQEFTVEEVIEAWKSRFDDESDSELSLLNERYSLTSLLLSLLADGYPVSATQLAERSGLTLEHIETTFNRFKIAGGEFDNVGNLVGAALTLNSTPHRFRVNGKQLFTWCSLDAIFLPGLLEQTAEVESTCPVTGEPIRLTIAPDGIVAANPEQAVLSITIPGVSCATGDSCAPNKTGPKSDACSQMHFFSSREAAEIWLIDHPGVVIFSLDEAYRLARENWIDRMRKSDVVVSNEPAESAYLESKMANSEANEGPGCRC